MRHIYKSACALIFVLENICSAHGTHSPADFFGGSIAYRGGSENNTLLFPAPCVHTNRGDGGCFVVVYIVVGPEALLLLKNKT